VAPLSLPGCANTRLIIVRVSTTGAPPVPSFCRPRFLIAAAAATAVVVAAAEPIWVQRARGAVASGGQCVPVDAWRRSIRSSHSGSAGRTPCQDWVGSGAAPPLAMQFFAQLIQHVSVRGFAAALIAAVTQGVTPPCCIVATQSRRATRGGVNLEREALDLGASSLEFCLVAVTIC